jgi:glycosyltransferase involved in cell wall biosynthesis
MKIAVNTRLLLKNKLEGIGWFTYESLKRITTQHPEHHFYFIFDRPYDESFIFSDNITPVVQGPQARHPFLYYTWFELMLPGLLKKLGPDVFLSPDGYCSLRSDVRTLPVFHDLNFEHYPGDLPCLTRNYYRHFFPKYARKATRIATVSEFSRQDISKLYGINPDLIDVVYDGGSDAYFPLDEEEIREVRSRIPGGSPYFIFIGALNPRKNLINLFKAFDIFRGQSQSECKLLIAGARMWWTREMESVYQSMKFREEVIFLGRIGTGELRKYLGAAIGLTYISYFEGFGIPIVEAFRSGVPVITSNVTSMPEVAGDAALLVDPFIPGSIAEAMDKVFTDETLRKAMVARGFERKEIFTWQKTADRLWESIEKTLTST